MGLVHQFNFGDAVVCDGAPDIRMIVTGFMYRLNDEVQVECSHWSNSEMKAVWVAIWRLSLA